MSLTSVMGVPGSRRKTKLRMSQIEDDIWVPALRIAVIRGDSLSGVMRDAVKRYRDRHKHLLGEQDENRDAQ